MPGERRSWLSWLLGSSDSAPVGGTRSAPIPRRAPEPVATHAPLPLRRRRPLPAKPYDRQPPVRVPTTGSRAPVRASMAGIASWAYQLQGIKIAEIAAADADVCVIDCTPDGRPEQAFTADQVERMRGHGGGRGKRVLCYMSIGEAEEQRFYWNDAWSGTGGSAPAWLGPANEAKWQGNYNVRYWDRDWQDIIIDRADSYLNRIIAAGFDGVYLDIIDGYEFWESERRGADRRPTAAADMVEFVARIAEHCWIRRGKSQFLIVPQNGEGLLRYDRFRASISAIGKEDVLYQMVGDATEQPQVRRRSEAEIASLMQHLRLAQQDGLPVVAVEYLLDQPHDASRIPEATAHLRKLGLLPHFGYRDLGRLAPAIQPDMPMV